MWQKLSGDKWDFDQNLLFATFTEPAGYRQNPDSPLMPFLKQVQPHEAFWTSNDCRRVSDLDYEYEECLRTKDELKKFINDRYKWFTQVVNPRPPARKVTGYPRDLSLARCIPGKKGLGDGKRPLWSVDFVDSDPALTLPKASLLRTAVKADSTISPNLLGVEGSNIKNSVSPSSITKADANDTPLLSNTVTVRQWEVTVQYEK